MNSRALVAGLALLLTAAQQQPETGTFTMTQNGQLIMTERYTRGPAAIDGIMFVSGGPRVSYNARVFSGAISEITLKVFAPTDSIKPAQTANIRFSADSMVLETVRNGAPVREPRVAPRGVVPLINPSVLWMEEIVKKAKAMGGASASVPVAMLSAPQQVFNATVTFSSPTQAKLQLAELEINLVLDAQGRVQSGDVPSQQITMARTN